MVLICVTVLVGLPGAGKTTFCIKLKEYLKANPTYNSHIITYDNIIEDSYKNDYKESRNRCLQIVENIITGIFDENHPKKNLILVDDNMYYKSMRYDYFKLAKKYEISLLQVYFDIKMELALSRNKNRKAPVPESIIREMETKLEIPITTHNWESNLLVINANDELNETVFENFLGSVDKALNCPVRNVIEKEIKIADVSILHEVDLVLRKIVGDKIRDDTSQASIFIAKRKEIYSKIKNGDILIDVKSSKSELRIALQKLF